MFIKSAKSQIQERESMLDRCLHVVKRAHVEQNDAIVKDAIQNSSDLFEQIEQMEKSADGSIDVNEVILPGDMHVRQRRLQHLRQRKEKHNDLSPKEEEELFALKKEEGI